VLDGTYNVSGRNDSGWDFCWLSHNADVESLFPYLDGLPLSISLAGAYLRDPKNTVEGIISQTEAFLADHESTCDDNFTKAGAVPTSDYAQRTARSKPFAIWKMTYDHLAWREPVAARLVDVLSLYGHSNIRPELLLMHRKVQQESSSHATDADTTADANGSINGLRDFLGSATKRSIQDKIDVLKDCALLNEGTRSGSASMHRMIRTWTSENIRLAINKKLLFPLAISLVAAMAESFGHEFNPHGHDDSSVAHAKAIGAFVKSLDYDESLGIDCMAIAGYLEQWEYSKEVENLYAYAQRAFEKTADRRWYRATYKLGIIYHNRGLINRAGHEMERVLEQAKATAISGDDEYVSMSSALCGCIWAEQAEYVKAMSYLQRARRGFESSDGLSSLRARQITQKLGLLALRMGRLDVAVDMLSHVRQGPTLTSSSTASLRLQQLSAAPGLIEAYLRLGSVHEAEATALSVCKDAEKILGPTHPSTYARYYTLAIVYAHQHKFELAKQEYDKAIDGRSMIIQRDRKDIYDAFIRLEYVTIDRNQKA
jgi:tetratricopeptide (TPR) repeat protein